MPDATYYRIGYVNMEVDYHLAKASCTGEWLEAFVYIDVNAQNVPVATMGERSIHCPASRPGSAPRLHRADQQQLLQYASKRRRRLLLAPKPALAVSAGT